MSIYIYSSHYTDRVAHRNTVLLLLYCFFYTVIICFRAEQSLKSHKRRYPPRFIIYIVLHGIEVYSGVVCSVCVYTYSSMRNTCRRRYVDQMYLQDESGSRESSEISMRQNNIMYNYQHTRP